MTTETREQRRPAAPLDSGVRRNDGDGVDSRLRGNDGRSVGNDGELAR